MERRLVLTGLAGLIGLILSDEAMASALTDKNAQKALREALDQGTDAAVSRVSKPDGYWGDDLIRIPLPKSLVKVEKGLKPLGMSGLLDDVHLRMNRAAETAAPVARGLFIDAIKSLTIKDAIGIVKGGNTAGTEYLQRTTTPRLTSAFLPSMESAMQATGAVQVFDRAIRRNNLQNVVKTDAKTYLGQYVTGLALNGLFHYVGVEEIAIRRSPAKRTSQILKAVFG